jgi:hypothetical protein
MAVGPILIGAGLTLFGFLLAMAWDLVKVQRERNQRDESILRAARDEVDAVQATVTNNRNLIQTELGYLGEQPPTHLVNPLDPLEGGFWDVVKLNPPRALVREPDTLARVRDVARRTDQINEMIRSREAFRVSNLAISNFDSRLRSYDELLQQFQAELLEALDSLRSGLDAAARS